MKTKEIVNNIIFKDDMPPPPPDFPDDWDTEWQPSFEDAEKKITYKPVCRVCGKSKKLVTIKRAEGDYHLCPKHTPAWMKIANKPKTKKNGGKSRRALC